ncbi:MAG: hypothetical protein AAF412_07905 [Pseudomonadota bacterium]
MVFASCVAQVIKGNRMLYWKNKQINTLSNEELRAALSETIRMLLTKDSATPDRSLFSSFVAGTFFGMISAGLVVTLALAI